MESGTNFGTKFPSLFRHLPALGALALSAGTSPAVSDLLDHLRVAFLAETLRQPVVDEHRVEGVDIVVEDDLAECSIL